MALGRMPNYVIAFVNGRCNMLCDFCCDAAMSIRKAPEMSVEQWQHALDGADALIHLTFTGGEPFLRKDLESLILCVVESNGVPRMSINTNAYFTDRIESTMQSLLPKLDGREICLSISLDGPPEIHDTVRQCKGAFAAARRTIDAVSPIRDQFPGFTLRVSSVLHPGNVEFLESFLDETDKWPVDFHELILVRDVTREVQMQLADTYERLTARQLERASDRYSGNADWRIDRLMRNDILDRVHDRGKATPCLAGGRMVEVLSDGTVRGCEVGKMWDHSVMGNVSEGKRLVDIVASPEAKAFREKARRCTCTFECSTSCNIVFTPTRWPQLI
jgi:MoaA/NifB/PqqE/SkfB family radical SAM enzyme